MLRRFSKYENYILIAPDGYDRQWNVSRQRSKAPDVDFIKTIIDRIQHFSNVDNKQITIIGMSNGSALLNRLMIELGISIEDYSQAHETKNSLSEDQESFDNSNDDKSDDKSNEKIADDSIESIPFIAEETKQKRSRSNK